MKNIKRIISPLHHKLDNNVRFFDMVSADGSLFKDDTLYVFVETGGSEEIFQEKIVPKLADFCHLVLIASPFANALAASLEIKTYLHANYPEIRVRLVHGEAAEVIKQLSQREDQKSEMSNGVLLPIVNDIKIKKNYGVIGPPSNWLIGSIIDYSVAEEHLGIRLIDFSMDSLRQEIEATTLEEVLKNETDLVNYNLDFQNNETILSLRILGALLRIIRNNLLDGLTIRCFDLLGIYQNTSCFALAYLNEHGYIATCEGDIPALITMALLHYFTNEPSFQANPSYLDFENYQLILAHCTVPFSMCEKYAYMTHFESGLGLGIRGEMPLGTATIVKIAPNLRELLLIKGEICANMTKPDLCRTQIAFSLKKSAMDGILCANVANHLVVTYGNPDRLIEILCEPNK